MTFELIPDLYHSMYILRENDNTIDLWVEVVVFPKTVFKWDCEHVGGPST